MIATIVRQEHNDTETLGTMLLDGKLFCYTLELPWRNNQPNISCIPEGIYECERYQSDAHGSVMGVLGVPGRSGIILGHVGNTHHDTTGCILLGRYPGQLTKPGSRAVISSAQMVAAWNAWIVEVQWMTLAIIGVRTWGFRS